MFIESELKERFGVKSTERETSSASGEEAAPAGDRREETSPRRTSETTFS